MIEITNNKSEEMKKSYLFLAEGFEDIEAISVVDVLRRGGVEVEMVSITGQKQVKSAHGIEVVADRTFEEIKWEEADCLICPGGMPGAQYLSECSPLLQLLQQQYESDRLLAAICAAPALVFGKLNLGKQLQMTCYPGFEGVLPNNFVVSSQGVVVDGKIITAKGPGLAIQFGLAILKELCSADVEQRVASGMLL